MADDAARIAQLEDEARESRERYAALSDEVDRRGRALDEALEQQAATAEVLRVIASVPTDVQRVLDTVAQSALRLCAANQVVVYRLEDGLMRFAATGRPDTEANSFECDQNLWGAETARGRSFRT